MSTIAEYNLAEYKLPNAAHSEESEDDERAVHEIPELSGRLYTIAMYGAENTQPYAMDKNGSCITTDEKDVCVYACAISRTMEGCAAIIDECITRSPIFHGHHIAQINVRGKEVIDGKESKTVPYCVNAYDKVALVGWFEVWWIVENDPLLKGENTFMYGETSYTITDPIVFDQYDEELGC